MLTRAAFLEQPFLTINSRKVYFSELLDNSYLDSVPADGYEAKTLEFCASWLRGLQEVPVQTSGSTGLPKTIVLHRSQMEASAKLTKEFFGLEEGDRILVCLNTEVIGGLMMLVRGLTFNFGLTIIDPVAHPLLLFPPEEVAFDFVSLVPYQLEAILNGPPDSLQHFGKMKAVLLGGAAVTSNLEKQIQELEVPVYLGYGMTETCSHVALRRLNGKAKSELYTPLSGVKIWLNEKGCICVSGPMTDGKTIETNDLAELNQEGSFRLLGRADDVINSGGVKIHPALLEPAISEELEKLGLYCRFFIAGLPHARLGQEVTLVLELPEITSANESELLAALNQRLPKFEAPRAVLGLTRFQETLSRKIDKPATLAAAGVSFS